MRDMETVATEVNKIVINSKLTFEQRKTEIKKLELTHEELLNLILGTCEVWTSIPDTDGYALA